SSHHLDGHAGPAAAAARWAGRRGQPAISRPRRKTAAPAGERLVKHPDNVREEIDRSIAELRRL
ncbi:hypothetical protein, partial [Nonomuraea sp. NPDC003201]